MPPLSAKDSFPAIGQMYTDLAAEKATGDAAAATSLIRSNSLRVWFAVEAIAAVAGQSGATDAKSLKAALDSGKTFVMPLGPAWTPTAHGPAGFAHLSRPYAYASTMTSGQTMLARPNAFNVFPNA